MTEASPDTESPGRLALVAEAAGMALAAAMTCALPAAVRGVQGGGGVIDGLVSSAALLLLVAAPAAFLAPRAARGWRGVIGKEPPRHLRLGIALWAALSVLVLTALASVLEARTHHRGLGGATFGIVGAVAVAGCAVVAVRLLSVGRALLERGLPRPALVGLTALILSLPLATLTMPLLRADAADGGMQSALFDLLVAAAAGSLILRRRPPEALTRPVRVGALPLAVCVLIVGLVRLETAPAAADAVRRGGGLPGALLWALERWSDRDGDGVGAHFGGRDCDEGDPRRHPGAEDPPGDGVDADCDGRDGVLAVADAANDTAAAVAPAATAARGDEAPSADRPDIVLVTLDTVRADHTSLHGYARDTTPALAELARRGVVFERAYGAGSDTQPALMPLVTGMRYGDSPHTRTEWPRIRDEAETVAERLKEAGYATGAVTSFTWLRGDRGFDQGFDHFDESPWSEVHPEREVTGDRAARATTAMYEKLAAGKAPLFLWVHLFDAHAKYLEHPGIDFGKKPMDRYDGEIAFVDAQLATILRTVERSPRAARTVYVVHGSHGEAFGEHGKEGHGEEVYDEELHVPLVVVTPASAAARWDRDAVSVLDVPPTILDYGGASRTGMAGISLRPAVDGDATFEHAPVVARAPRRVAVIDLPLKLVVRERKDGEDRLLLYDLPADPGEKTDVSDKHSDDLARLNALRKAAH
jgi:arylsulfatase A-like enzyme